ncbi:MAG: protein kinase [Acidobacteriota bacterium]
MSRPSNPRPRHVADYEIEREIGQGGMGVVYLAHQQTLERPAVLKKIRRELLTDTIAVERFRREACAAAAVHHQNVVAVYDAFEWRNDLYIAQELVDGQDLRAILDKAKRLRPEIAALIALEVVRGLEEIHARGIVHRDVKPGNVLIGWEGETKIADFGIALAENGNGLTRPGLMVGSVHYMSPEQILGEPLDHRSDLFLLGILLYEMIAGMPPFQESTDASADTLLHRIQDGRFTPLRKIAPQAPRYLARLIRFCLRARPAQRVPSTTAVRRLLERRLRSHSPADCRRRIAIYLRERGILEPIDEHTAVRPRQPGARAQPRGARFPQRRLPDGRAGLPSSLSRRVTVAASLLMAVITTGYVLRPASTGTTRAELAQVRFAEGSPLGANESGSPPPTGSSTGSSQPAPTGPAVGTVPSPSPEPASVRFVAYPWAEIRVDDGPPFLTPRALPVELPPGSHRVVFTHPTYGEAEVTIDVEPGETLDVRHEFEKAAGR